MRRTGGIDDFGKFALLRHLMTGRLLAVCACLTANDEVKDGDKYYEYLSRPDEFRHFAPEVFDLLAEIVRNRRTIPDPLAAIGASGVLGNAVFIRHKLPKQIALRPRGAEELVKWLGGANLVFLDPDSGIQGKRLTHRHVALAEIAALRQTGRVLIVSHHQSGRKAEVKYLADQMMSLGCDRVEIVRLRLVTSCLYVILDQDEVMAELTATFVKKWGSWAKSYRA